MASTFARIKKALKNPALVPWLAGHRMGTLAGYWLGPVLRDSAFPPETVNIYPTTRCNLKCSMCFEKYYHSGPELSLPDWLGIIGDLGKFHPRIHLSGGEPFIYDNIIELIAGVKKAGLSLHITTNGAYLEKYAADLVKLKVDRLDVSIDGPEEVHDEIRGVKGTYAAILRGFGKIKELKKNRKLPALKINSIINLEKPGTMRDIISLAKRFGVGSVQFIHPLFLDAGAIEKHRVFMKENLGTDLNYWLMASRFKPAVPDVDALAGVLNELGRKGSITVDVFPRLDSQQMVVYYNDSVNFHAVYRGDCRAMWNTLTILPDGNAESCPDYIVGNCRQQGATRIWNSDVMRGLRRRIRKKAFFSVCRACCFYYQK